MRAPDIRLLLPEVMQRSCVDGSAMDALIEVMEAMHAPSEAVLADLGQFFDPQNTPDRFVALLAQWMDLDGIGRIETGRMRQLVAAAGTVNRLRGTAEGLRQVLVMATGLAGIMVESPVTVNGAVRPFQVRVVLPAGAGSMLELASAIVAREKPAHVLADVVIGADAQPAQAP